ncbi:unnamed protein product [Adineta ricciae]|uniref:Lysozyme n=1 Tax=Adineta ricciae TaxID=249248 RepID=A0A815BQ51_ADIRI|nr:unnamed protein product [Adineta ricciae]
MLMFVQLTLILAIPSTLGIIGVNVYQKVSQEQFECLKDKGYEFVIVRTYRKNGVVDRNSAITIKNARAAGFTHVDGYLLPCISCGDPSQQIFTTIDYLKDENADIDMLWLDIQGKWYNDTESNIQFLQDLILEMTTSGIKHGICTSPFQWITIMNNARQFSSESSLWYVRHDNKTTFDNFQMFGGWKQPSIKQYVGSVKECGVILDRNFL